MHGNYFVAFCDILGFSDLVSRSALDEVVGRNLSRFRQILQYSFHQVDFPEHPPELSVLQSHDDVGLAWFSDSIFLYSLRDDNKAVKAVLRSVEWLIWTTLSDAPFGSIASMPIRCGVSYGRAFIDPRNSLFVGPPIVEAAKLEGQQIWAGGALTPAARDRLPENVRDGQYADWPLRPYSIPLRDGKSYEGLAVEWTWGVHPPGFEMRWSEEHKDPTPDDWRTRPDVCLKFLNTRFFHDTGQCCGRRGVGGRDA